ncbi:hypothetical protein [Microcystis sp. M061S2]|uniref:hypothetical protein n=1 Tax=Microcystis sp. M061S2 TaxID=2771171 RepID=UPI00258A161A|nr:hypothetical protein [Microcystis sp. M061S2]MCA2656378.1 hypothetical protein [Microcystis sp. M061S2]
MKKYALHTSKATAAKRYEALDRQKATEKQKALMRELKIEFPKQISKLQAMGLIDKKIKENRKRADDPISYENCRNCLIESL